MFDTPPPNLPTPQADPANMSAPKPGLDAFPPAGGGMPPVTAPRPAALPSSGPAPVKPSGEPDDIFAGIEQPVIKPSFQPSVVPPLRPATSAPSVAIPSEYLEGERSFPWRGVVVAFVAVVVVGGVGYAAYFYRDQIFNLTTPDASTDTTGVTNNNGSPENELPNISNTPTVPLNSGTIEPVEITPADATVDDDGDGLTNVEEATLGTDPTLYDTDNDKLFDGEEVNTFQTDPLVSDTDGDGFFDGDEVRNGYNPKGPGRLFNVPEAE